MLFLSIFNCNTLGNEFELFLQKSLWYPNLAHCVRRQATNTGINFENGTNQDNYNSSLFFFLDTTLFIEVENGHRKLETYSKIKKASEIVKSHATSEL